MKRDLELGNFPTNTKRKLRETNEEKESKPTQGQTNRAAIAKPVRDPMRCSSRFETMRQRRQTVGETKSAGSPAEPVRRHPKYKGKLHFLTAN